MLRQSLKLTKIITKEDFATELHFGMLNFVGDNIF